MTSQFTIRLCPVITEGISARVQLYSAFQSLTSCMGTLQSHSGKMSAHAPLFSPWRLPVEEAMTRSAKTITGATNFIAMLRLLNFSY